MTNAHVNTTVGIKNRMARSPTNQRATRLRSAALSSQSLLYPTMTTNRQITPATIIPQNARPQFGTSVGGRFVDEWFAQNMNHSAPDQATTIPQTREKSEVRARKDV
jgi:hypothetical protein